MIRSTNLYEVQEYVNLTTHLLSWAYIVIGNKQFMKMPPAFRELFIEAARDMQRYEHDLMLKHEISLRRELEDRGMIFIEVDKEAFREIGSPAVYQSLSEDMKKIYNQIIQIE